MDENWYVRETEVRRTAVRQQESVFTIGNGYLSTRGAFEEGLLGDLPATLIHGVFDDAPIVETEPDNLPATPWFPDHSPKTGQTFGAILLGPPPEQVDEQPHRP